MARCGLDLWAIARLRVVPSAETLLRIIFAYAWNDWSLRTTAAWAHRMTLVDLSDVAVLKRPAWLGHLLDPWFRSSVTSRFRLVLTDGSTIQRPGSTGTTWQLHAHWNLGTGRWDGELTDAHGGELLTRWHWRPHDVVLADRHDAKPSALAWIHEQRAQVIVRFGWNALRIQAVDGTPWSVLDAVRVARCRGMVGANSRSQRPPHPPGAMRKSLAEAEKARRTARQDARSHGHTVTPAPSEVAHYVLILTTLSAEETDAAEILE